MPVQTPFNKVDFLVEKLLVEKSDSGKDLSDNEGALIIDTELSVDILQGAIVSNTNSAETATTPMIIADITKIPKQIPLKGHGEVILQVKVEPGSSYTLKRPESPENLLHGMIVHMLQNIGDNSTHICCRCVFIYRL